MIYLYTHKNTHTFLTIYKKSIKFYGVTNNDDDDNYTYYLLHHLYFSNINVRSYKSYECGIFDYEIKKKRVLLNKKGYLNKYLVEYLFTQLISEL